MQAYRKDTVDERTNTAAESHSTVFFVNSKRVVSYRVDSIYSGRSEEPKTPANASRRRRSLRVRPGGAISSPARACDLRAAPICHPRRIKAEPLTQIACA
jgi:hypothetical protein